MYCAVKHENTFECHQWLELCFQDIQIDDSGFKKLKCILPIAPLAFLSILYIAIIIFPESGRIKILIKLQAHFFLVVYLPQK